MEIFMDALGIIVILALGVAVLYISELLDKQK